MAKAPKASKSKLDESNLTKMQLRKLNALRKSLGDEIAEKAFREWFDRFGDTTPAPQVDKNAQVIVETLGELVNSGKLRIPRGGYHLARGRGRVIVTRARD